MQDKIALESLAQRIGLDAAYFAVIGEIDAQMIACCEADDFKRGARAQGYADGQDARADGDFTGAVLDEGALRDFRGARDPGEDFRKRVPKSRSGGRTGS